MKSAKETVALGLGLLVCFGIIAHCTGCRGASVPSPATVEAGVDGVTGLCTFLEGITENQTVISICATAEEIAWAVASFVPLLVKGSDAGACTPLGGVCATPAQLGKMIQAVVSRRRSMFFLDAGAK